MNINYQINYEALTLAGALGMISHNVLYFKKRPTSV